METTSTGIRRQETGDGRQCSLSRSPLSPVPCPLSPAHVSRANPSQKTRSVGSHSGFTLLEVILAIAVLAISLTTILEVMRNAYRNADSATIESEAQIYAESILAELATGIRPATAVQGAPLELDDQPMDEWQYSIAIEPTMQDEIVLARVLVESVREDMKNAPKVEIAQWFLNPELMPSASGSSTGSTFSSGSSSGSSSVTGSGQ